jgi:hypothetical protein
LLTGSASFALKLIHLSASPDPMLLLLVQNIKLDLECTEYGGRGNVTLKHYYNYRFIMSSTDLTALNALVATKLTAAELYYFPIIDRQRHLFLGRWNLRLTLLSRITWVQV